MAQDASTSTEQLSSSQRIKRALSHGKQGRISKNTSNKVMLGVFRLAAAITTLVLVAIIATSSSTAFRISRSISSSAGPTASTRRAVSGPPSSRPST